MVLLAPSHSLRMGDFFRKAVKAVVKFCLTLVLAYLINQLISRLFAYYLPDEGAGAIFIPILIFSFDLLAGYAIACFIFKVAAKK
ncbi:hypothetical protein P421_10295 [Heyndrickxia coagulans P38]|nr:hypothetical protein P421_10295 [Heyndrickxia coagulans P38]